MGDAACAGAITNDTARTLALALNNAWRRSLTTVVGRARPMPRAFLTNAIWTLALLEKSAGLIALSRRTSRSNVPINITFVKQKPLTLHL
jgi:hypothetical protein